MGHHRGSVWTLRTTMSSWPRHRADGTSTRHSCLVPISVKSVHAFWEGSSSKIRRMTHLSCQWELADCCFRLSFETLSPLILATSPRQFVNVLFFVFFHLFFLGRRKQTLCRPRGSRFRVVLGSGFFERGVWDFEVINMFSYLGPKMPQAQKDSGKNKNKH